MSDSNNSSDCFDHFQEPKFLGLLITSIVLSVFSSLFLFGMMGIIILFKKYVFLYQRLLLYLAITSFLFSVTSLFNVTSPYAHKNMHARKYCVFIGFVSQFFIWCQIMSIACVMIDVFIKIALEKDTRRFEILYVITIIGLPLTTSLPPFYQLAYGPAGVYCWIRDRIYEDCSYFNVGLYMRFILFYVPLYLLMLTLAILAIISLYCARKRRKQWSVTSAETIKARKKLESEIRPLIAYPAVYIVITILPLIQRIYGAAANPSDSDKFYYFLTVTQVLAYRSLGVIYTIIFILDKETRKKLNWVEIRAAFRRWCGNDENTVVTYDVQKARTDSLSATTSSNYILMTPYTKADVSDKL